jgi:hypothetical protein
MNRTDIRDTLEHAASGASFEGWIREPEQIARKLLAADGHDPDRPGWMPTLVPEGSSLAAAHEILRQIRIARSSIRKGNADAATHAGLQIGWLIAQYDLKADWEAAALRGRRFIEGPKAKRMDPLARLIESALQELGPSATAREIFAHVQIKTDVAQEPDDNGTIYWMSRGREKKTSYKAFSNRVATLRKRINRPNDSK